MVISANLNTLFIGKIMPSNWKKRVDAQKNKAKVANAVLQDPLATQEQIAQKTWLGKTTVHEHLKELPKSNKDNRILAITDTDLVNVTLWQNELQRRLQEIPEKLKTQEIVQIIAEGTARYTKLRGANTDEQGAELKIVTDKQLDAINSILSTLGNVW